MLHRLSKALLSVFVFLIFMSWSTMSWSQVHTLRVTDTHGLPPIYFEQEDTRLGNIILSYANIYANLSKIDEQLAEIEAGVVPFEDVSVSLTAQFNNAQQKKQETDLKFSKYIAKHKNIPQQDLVVKAEVFAQQLMLKVSASEQITSKLIAFAGASQWQKWRGLASQKQNSYLVFLQAEIIAFELNSTFVAPWTPEYHLLQGMKQGNIVSLAVIEFMREFDIGHERLMEALIQKMQTAYSLNVEALANSQNITNVLERELNSFFTVQNDKNNKETAIFVRAYRDAVDVEKKITDILKDYISLCRTMQVTQLSNMVLEERLIELDAEFAKLTGKRANLRSVRPSQASALLRALNQ